MLTDDSRSTSDRRQTEHSRMDQLHIMFTVATALLVLFAQVTATVMRCYDCEYHKDGYKAVYDAMKQFAIDSILLKRNNTNDIGKRSYFTDGCETSDDVHSTTCPLSRGYQCGKLQYESSVFIRGCFKNCKSEYPLPNSTKSVEPKCCTTDECNSAPIYSIDMIIFVMVVSGVWLFSR
ncbi:uncharacterized protein LOC141904604 [Tubulanus polymorphus]|uniref:uncharacterized protein LOC141904604 n=1 Tax=Tubulanus polymorphus TaxID=672921 RepID=UPI003DA1EDE2